MNKFKLEDLSLLRELISAPGISGDENEIATVISKHASKYVDNISSDHIGNLIAFKKGNELGKKVMITAHMDEIGFMVKTIEKGGFIRVVPIGGIDPSNIMAQRVMVMGKRAIPGVIGCKPIHMTSKEDRGKSVTKVTDIFIDVGLSEDEVKEIVSIGDSVTRIGNLQESGKMVSAKSMDNRVCAFAVLQTLMLCENSPHDLYFVFTTQEEVGLRGVRVAMKEIKPDIGINLDVCIACDTPGSPEHQKEAFLGGGPTVVFMDSSVICNKGIIKKMTEVAKNSEINIQYEVSVCGGTDTAALSYITGQGCIAGCLSIPLRYMHSTVESAYKSDIEDTVNLLHALLLDGLDIS